MSLPLPPTKLLIEQAAQKFLDFGIGVNGNGAVIIRSGALGSFVQSHEVGGAWVDPFHAGTDAKVVDVTGGFCDPSERFLLTRFLRRWKQLFGWSRRGVKVDGW